MSDNKHDSVISFYIPLVLIAAFMLGCLSVALISVRENAFSIISGGIVSDSDSGKKENTVRKSPVYDDEGLRFRMVSASDLGIGEKKTSKTNNKPKESVSSDHDSDKSSDDALRLPMEHYINFVPHKRDCTAYLTFDDGPSENAGHTIALHSYTHDYSKVYAGESSFFDEMNRIGDYIYQQTGVRTKLMRFPGGSSNTVSRKYSKGLMEVLKKSVKERGYVYQDWNVDSCDAEKANTAPQRLLYNVRTSLGDKKTAVILMHDSGSNTATTVQALPEIIEFFYSNGYSMEKMNMTTEEVHHNW